MANRVHQLKAAPRTEQQAAADIAQSRMLDPTRFAKLRMLPGYWRGAAKVREDMADLCAKGDGTPVLLYWPAWESERFDGRGKSLGIEKHADGITAAQWIELTPPLWVSTEATRDHR